MPFTDWERALHDHIAEGRVQMQSMRTRLAAIEMKIVALERLISEAGNEDSLIIQVTLIREQLRRINEEASQARSTTKSLWIAVITAAIALVSSILQLIPKLLQYLLTQLR